MAHKKVSLRERLSPATFVVDGVKSTNVHVSFLLVISPFCSIEQRNDTSILGTRTQPDREARRRPADDYSDEDNVKSNGKLCLS